MSDDMVERVARAIANELTIDPDDAAVRVKFNRLVAVPADKEQCWIWIGATTDNQHGLHYGSFPYRGKSCRAHRVSYAIHKGPVPANLVVRHRCDNTLCVNPEHLELGTQLDNMRDKRERGRERYLRGSQVPNSKLAENQVLDIRKRCASGAKQAVLAREYGVTRWAIWRVIHRGWKHLTPSTEAET